MMPRLPGWRARLAAAIASANAPFAWGAHDCCTGLAGPCILALTGVNLAEQFYGKYSTAKGAVRVLNRAGYDDLAALAAAHFQEYAHASQAQIGDIAAFRSEDTGWALGIVLGERIAVLSPSGYATQSRLAAARAFKVG